jgi:uncharacterized protein YecE (DUF72 family)
MLEVATGGWSVPDWYEPGVEARDRLGALAERLDAVEVDSSFYALPAARTVERWASITPERFMFSVKLHRALSRHAAPLKSLPTDLRDDVRTTGRGRIVLTDELEAALCDRTMRTFAPLRTAGRLRCFLLQLTPAFNPADHALDELEPLVQHLAPVPVAIELRHQGWIDRKAQTLAWFERAGAAFVCVDAPRTDAPVALPPMDAVTRSDLAYLRAHGRDAERYLRGRSAAERFDYAYSDKEIGELVERARNLEAEHVTVVFANGAHALDAALAFRASMVSDRPSSR